MTTNKPTTRELYEVVCISIFGWMIDASPPLQEVGALFEGFENYVVELSQGRKRRAKEKDAISREPAARIVPNGGGPFPV